MGKVLLGCNDCASSYIDDLLIYSKDWSEHLGHIRLVLGRLRECGLTAKPGKCQ